MGKSTHSIFKFHEEDGVETVLEAFSYSEARRKYRDLTGRFPHKDQEIEVDSVR